MNITKEIAKHRKTGILVFFSPTLDPFRMRYHSWVYNHHLTKAAHLAELGIGEFGPNVDLHLTPYGPKILQHMQIARNHIDAEKRIRSRP